MLETINKGKEDLDSAFPGFHSVSSRLQKYFQKRLDILLYFYVIGSMENIDAISVLSALAQETRLDVFRLLVRAGKEGMAAGAIGDALSIPAATLSFHLKELKNAGTVCCQREGRSLIYSADFSTMTAFLGFLTENCCQGVNGEDSEAQKPGSCC